MVENSEINALLDSQWLKQSDRFHARADEVESQWLQEWCAQNPEFESQLKLAWSCSDFISNYTVSQSQRFRQLVESGDLNRVYTTSEYVTSLQTATDGLNEDDQWSVALRRFRNREMVRIVWRDFCGLADLQETTKNMSALAAACLDIPLQYLHQSLRKIWGWPVGKYSGDEQHLIVLGMGKLGADELNVSSDIDLIFVYPEAGETEGGSRRRNISNQEFFEKVGRGLIQLLDNHTGEGFVFRVDMRLRPYGESGPLVGNFDAMESYYQTQGRDWERFAMVKAMPVAGDLDKGKEMLEILRPFTYRKYIDFSAIQALRDIKGMIEQEVLRTDSSDDVKRGRGGIREVEFIAQAFQLIRGGRDLHLRNPVLKDILPQLETMGALGEGKADELYQAYVFLRRVEHVVQGINDRQTQKLPQSNLDKARLLAVLNFENWDLFIDQLDAYRTVISQEFAVVVADGDDTDKSTVEDEEDLLAAGVWQRLQRQEGIDDELLGALATLQLEPVEECRKLLCGLLASKPVQVMQASARDRLNVLMPRVLLGCAADGRSSVELLQRILRLIEAVARRSAYLLLLTENPLALKQLLILCRASPWIAEQITRYPALLDELLDPRALYTPRTKLELADELRQQLLRIPEDDLELHLEALRYFKLSNSLRVAACEVTNALPLMKVSDNLTWIAEVLLEQAMELAWQQMRTRHGEPGYKEGEPKPGFLILGYGKLGGIELGHNSDLDLVFIHNANVRGYSDGVKSIDNGTYFARLGQKIIHMLSAQTSSGILYEVDMRLRPSGNSGMLVTTLPAFKKYQLEEAWIWEHQALVRARPVAGSELLAEEFQSVRQDILSLPRDKEALSREVTKMREKMAEHLLSREAKLGGTVFSIKQGRGGIVDIEFLVQFLILAEAANHPELAHWSDNIRLLDDVARFQLLPAELAAKLIEIYQRYRSIGHRAQLQNKSLEVPVNQLAIERETVISIWNRLLPVY